MAYTKTTNFATKDALSSGDPLKIVKGTELNTEFDNIATASALNALKGANSDITSLSGLTTPLSIAQGGTNATTAGAARTSLGTAASGANADITSMTALTAPTVAANPIRAADLQVQLATAFTTGGTATAFTLTPAPAITANAANQRFRVKFNAAAGTTPTLAVSGQAALNLKYKDSAGTKQAITSTQVPINWVSDVENDGTDWVVLSVAGIAGIPQNIRSAAYTTVLADANTHILHPSADTTARIFTIDSNANVAYPIGTAITFVNQNAGGVVTIAITTDTMRLAGAGTTGSRTLAANGIATAIKLTSTEWIISGTGLT